MRKIYIGIDPGAKGFACFHYTESDTYELVPLADTARLRTELEAARVVGDCTAVVENVHAMPSQGRSSIFSFGKSTGIAIGMLIALGIPYNEVPPARWQKEMWNSTDKVVVSGKVDTKKTSYAAARRLHPRMDFRRTGRCSSWDDNMVDATLMCDYAQRMNY